MRGEGITMDSVVGFVSLARKARDGKLSASEHIDLIAWVGKHGEDLLANMAELERRIADQENTMRDLHEVQSRHGESINTALSSLRTLTREIEATGDKAAKITLQGEELREKVARIESGIWSGPAPAGNGDRPRG